MPDEPTDDAEIRKILAKYPDVLTLFDEVRQFFEGYLRISSQSDPRRISEHSIKLDPLDDFHSATMKIVLGTDRVAAAITHELLHLKMLVDQFPTKQALDRHSPGIATCRGDFDFCHGAVDSVINVVQHEIFFDDFLRLGLPRSDFLSFNQLPIVVAEETKLRAAGLGVTSQAKAVATYFGLAVTARHAPCGSTPQEYLSMIERLWPSLHDVASNTETWVAHGEFRKPDKYANAVNQLLDWMELPSLIFRVLVKTPKGLHFQPVPA